MGEPPLMTSSEVAAFCRVSIETVRRWRRSKRLVPWGRNGRGWLFAMSARPPRPAGCAASSRAMASASPLSSV